MRVCLVYDCLFPYTVGGAERWYRNLGEALAVDGHEVTYLTLRQWDRGVEPDVPGVRVRAVGPRMKLYGGPGRRRILPPLVFGVGVLWHLLRRGGAYDVVQTASFPYFSLLAAAAARRRWRYRLVADWHEVWTRAYWREYLGTPTGDVGWLVQRACARLPQRAFCFSRLHAARLREEGMTGEVTILPGEWEGGLEPESPHPPAPLVVFAGRHIPEKQLLAIPPAIKLARESFPELKAAILGDGPDRRAAQRLVDELALGDVITLPGFVSATEVEDHLTRALCLLLPSRREGYGLIVLEAASRGTPSIVVSAPDNAAVELVAEGENGYVASSASPEDLAAAILRVRDSGWSLRQRTADWFRRNAPSHSLVQSLQMVQRAYDGA
jgi:glycosyltransferase involved in cell wall biosynthesis